MDELEHLKEKEKAESLKLVERHGDAIEAIEKGQGTIWGLLYATYIKLNRIDGINPQIIE